MAKKPPKDDSEDFLETSIIKALKESGYTDAQLKQAGFDIKPEPESEAKKHSRSKLKIVK